MAVSPQTSANSGLHAGERRLRYGLNVVISALVATGILVFAILIAREYSGQLDWTASGVNSLSPRTTQLLAGIDKPLRITALYSVPLAEDVEPVYQRRRDTISDLLDLYAASSNNVSVEVIDPLRDQLAVTSLLADLRNMPAYAEEAKPHQDFIKRFEAFNTTMQTTVDGIVAKCIDLAQQDPQINRDTEFGVVVIGLRNVSQASKSVAKILEEIKAADQPRYGEAAETITSTVTQMRGLVETARDWFNKQASNLGASADAKAFYAEAGQQCTPIADQLASFSKEGGELGEVELDKLLAEITDLVNRPAVLVRTDEKAEIVGFDDVWPFPLDPQAPRGDGPDPDRDFAGEQAISSAILRLTQTDRVGLVFVRFGGQPLLQPDFSNFNPTMGRMPEAPYQQMRGELEDENFVVNEWDVKASPTPPALEDVVQTVYIVFPPTPPQPAAPGQPPAEPGISEAQKKAIYDAVNASGMAIFLAGWQPPNQFGMSQPYAYEQYLEDTWGIKVESDHLLVRLMASPEHEGLWVPGSRSNDWIIMTTRDSTVLTDHPISKPLKALTAAFPQAAPLTLVEGDTAPKDITYEPLVQIQESERIWAVANIQEMLNDLRNKFGTKPKPDDIRSPVTLAYAAEKTAAPSKTDDASAAKTDAAKPDAEKAAATKPQRIAVFGSELFASDDLAFAMQLGTRGNSFVTFQAYPANRDLFINTMHWLTGDAARIAIGPQRGGVPTLDKLTAGPTVQFLKVFTVGIWPALALVAGGIVWLFRRS